MILDVATASIATGIPIRTIQRWVRNSWLTNYGDGIGRFAVDVDELAELVEKRPGGRLHKPPIVA